MIRHSGAVAAATYIALVLLMAIGLTSHAQGVQLTAEQQQMLNSLPPAQRQQALQAIRDLQSPANSQPPQSINEVDTAAEPSPADDVNALFLLDDEIRAMSRSRIVINFVRKENLPRTVAQSIDDDPVLRRLDGTRLFVLDDDGILSLQGLAEIPLLGLKEEDIERRLQAEESLSMFDTEVRILDQEPIGVEALQPFGYDVFKTRDTGFDSPSTGPVPPDYVLGAGDSVRVQFFGNVNSIYDYEVTRDGILNLPEIGPVTVAGLRFSEFREDLNKRVSNSLIGTQVSVTLGTLRAIRVFVLGDVEKPGSHVVGGLATISSALYKSGGVSDIGSLRNIQLKRGGQLVARLDVYDLLINGDTSDDRRLQQGDVIFVPPIGNTIAISGAVKRAAIYETRAGDTVADAVRLAGGLTAEAFAEGARLERVDGQSGRTTQSIDLMSAAAKSLKVGAGDTLLIPTVLPDIDNSIALSGHVYRPGMYAWRTGMRLTDLLTSPRELKPDVDMNYVLVRRERERGSPIEVVSTSLSEALARPGGDADIVLFARDQVFVFSLALGRQRIVQPIIEELSRQGSHDRPVMQVELAGRVRAPGTYPLESEMRISDLIRAGGSLSAEAYTLDAELTRYSVVDGERRIVNVVDVDLAGALRKDAVADLVLEPYDYLSISQVPEWDVIRTVTIEGEVRFPGQYRVRRGETLNEVLERAGGLTDSAFPEGAVFLRESLRKREQEQIELLARRLESDLTSLSLQLADQGGSDTLTTGRALLEQLRETEAVGRLVISPFNLQGAERRLSTAVPIEMKDGDRLMVPKRSQVVTVIGETQQNTSHLYLPDLARDDYINLSGGLTRRADKKRIYIVRANGAVVVGNSSRWLGRGGNIDVRPGDTIVVPLDADRMRPLTFWTNVTQIIYQGAIAVAAIRTFD